MDILCIPYIANILILLPVAPLTLLGGNRGNRLVFEGRFAESAGTRTILGSMWAAILLTSAVGVFAPVAMAPVLVLQVVYKSLWLLVHAIPCLIKGQMREVPRGVSISFIVIVATYPWVIPWNHLLAPLSP